MFLLWLLSLVFVTIRQKGVHERFERVSCLPKGSRSGGGTKGRRREEKLLDRSSIWAAPSKVRVIRRLSRKGSVLLLRPAGPPASSLPFVRPIRNARLVIWVPDDESPHHRATVLRHRLVREAAARLLLLADSASYTVGSGVS